MVYECVRIIVRKAQDIFGFVPRDDIVDVLRIEVFEFLQSSPGKRTYLFEVQHLMHVYSVHVRRQGDRLRLEVVLLIVFQGVQCGYEGRHIAPCFARKIIVYLPEILRIAAAADGLVDISHPAVVRCYRKGPVSEDFIRVAQILGGSVRGLHRVKPFIDE